jgi:pimeloyl-ACP methyl ester carboxylesterase
VNPAPAWREHGGWFGWSPQPGVVPEVQVFHTEIGDADAPALVLVHGFPTGSVDWAAVAPMLRDRFRVCAIDFPGFGFSDKPLGWGYALTRDAALLEHYASVVLNVGSMVVFAHDRGSSVAMLHATAVESQVRLDHLVLTNANIFLPLSNLTHAQRLMLDPATGPAFLAQVTPRQLAEGMGHTTYTPKRGPEDPEIEALATIFEHGGGLPVLHETIQYLRERAQDETSWLDALAALDVPTTLLWGLDDTVAPPRVVNHVWDRFVSTKPGRNSLYYVPDAGHYPQNDQPLAVVEAFLHALDAPDDAVPGALSERPGAPILVDRSRVELPRAFDLLPLPPS